ncbi:MAG TPA: LamG-like jellyroll fold domain-containing protein, partial [Candidatus Methylomirabilis sp.]|nr:LamG-like jellyroll fold domain-containing protein [Candidatus Methylomirabilis sp.]
SDASTGRPAPGYGGSVLVYSGVGSGGAQLDELRISNVQRTSFGLPSAPQAFPTPTATLLGGAGDQRGTGLTISNGALYATGSVTAVQTDADTSLLVKYPLPLGTPAWSRTIQNGTALFGLAATAEGVYPVGWNYSLSSDSVGDKEVKSYLGKFAADGSAGSAADGAQWVTTPNLFSYGGVEYLNASAVVTVDGTPYVFAVGGGQPCSYSAYTVVKSDSTTGARLAAATDSSVGVSLGNCYIPQGGGGSGAYGVTGLNGNLYVAGYSAWSQEGDTLGVPALWKHDASLNLIWRQKAADAMGGGFAAVTAFQGAIYAAGYVRPGGEGSEDFLVQKYAEDGSLLWSRTSGGAGTDVLTGITAVGSRLFAVGYTASYGAGGKDIAVLELSPTSGDTVVMTLHGGVQDDLASGAATDGVDLYVVGESKSYASAEGNTVGQNDVVILRYALPVSTYPLTVTHAGAGSGTVTSAPAGIVCGSTCQASFAPGTSVTLTATLGSGASFSGWTGDCASAGTDPTCTLALDGPRNVTAAFALAPATYTLTTATAGTGTGTIGAEPAGPSYAAGTQVTLTASPTPGATFTGWSGACTGTGTCIVIMDAAKSVTATFTQTAGPGAVTPYATEASTILLDHFDGSTSSSILAYRETGVPCWQMEPAATPAYAYGPGPNGLNQALSLYPPAGEPVNSQTYLQYPGGQLLSQANGTLEFWTYLTTYDSAVSIAQGQYPGACAGWTFGLGVSPTGQLQASAWAAFSMNSGAVTVPLNAWTHVAVTWGSTGAKLYLNDVLVGSDANTGMPASGYGGSVLVFSGAGSGGAQIDELRISNVQRTSFSLPPPSYSLTVTRQGTGAGTVTSAPAGITCGAACTVDFVMGAPVTLTASPDATSTFTGWSGACSGTEVTCAPTMSEARSVTASFTLRTYTVTVTPAGTGVGTVTSNLGGIACGSTCTSTPLASGTSVTLTASTVSGSTFAGWSGEGCTGTGTCTVSMTQARVVTATFQDATPPTITHAPVASKAVNLAIAVTATITDNFGVQTATLFYRTTGAGDYISAAMTAAGATYSGTIPEGAVTETGVQYYLEARDAAGNIRRAPNTAPGTPYSVAVGTSVFTDDPLSARSTPIKAVHFTQLLTAINTLRARYNLPAAAWTGTAPAPGGAVRAAHLTDLRTALAQAYTAAGKTPPTYTDPSLVAGQTAMKASHLTELRTLVRALE